MAFNTRRDFDQPTFDPTNPYGEEPDPTVPQEPFPHYPPNRTPYRPVPTRPEDNPNVEPYIKAMDPASAVRQPQPGPMGVGMPQPLPQPGPLQGGPPPRPPQGNPRPWPMPMPEAGPGPMSQRREIAGLPQQLPPVPKMNDYESSIMREGEINRGYDKQRDNPYSDTNFYKPGGLGDQMRVKEYADNDNMMDDILKRPRGSRGVTREIPASWSNMDLPDRSMGTPRGTIDPRMNTWETSTGDPARDKQLEDLIREQKEREEWEKTHPVSMQEARKKGITPVPYNRRNRAL